MTNSTMALLPLTMPAPSGVNLVLAVRRGSTVVDRLHQAAPCRVFFPDTDTDEPTLAVLVNTAGGLVGGDHIANTISLGAAAAATITTLAAEKIYRSAAPDCIVATQVNAGSGARLEWVPQETILFDGSRLNRRLAFELAEDAQLIAAETVLFGRSARGETLTQGYFRDGWTIRIGDRLVWVDTVLLSGDIESARLRPFGYGDAAGYATLVVAGPKAAGFLERGREIAAVSGAAKAGCSLVNEVLILRYMDKSAADLRNAVAASLVALRRDCFGLPPRLPRPWTI